MKRLALITLLCLAAGAAHAIIANLVRQYLSQSVTGQSIVVCVYQVNGQHFERYQPIGTTCQPYVEVR